jgi:hypothetical protein
MDPQSPNSEVSITINPLHPAERRVPCKSLESIGSIMSTPSVGSIMSTPSLGSIMSTPSLGSIMSTPSLGSIMSTPSVASIESHCSNDSGYHSVATNLFDESAALFAHPFYFPELSNEDLVCGYKVEDGPLIEAFYSEYECEDKAPRVDSGHGSINTSSHSGQSALPQQQDAQIYKRSRNSTGLNDLNNPKENAQSSHRSTEKFTERVKPTASDVPKCPAVGTTKYSLAQEDRTEQPGYIKKWVDSTCVVQSPPSGCSGEDMTCSGSDLGVALESFPAMSESEEDRNDTDSESFVLTEYSANSPNWDPTGAIIAPMRLEYIDQLLLSFSQVQLQWQSFVASDMAGSDRSTRSSSGKRRASSPPSSNSPDSNPPKKTKRQSTNDDDSNGQGGDDDGSTPHKTPSNIAEDGQGTCLFFACPFAKRYPHRYHKCYSYTLKDVARVKYHLFRDKVHRLPIYCPTCSERFSLEDIRDEHVRASNCAMKPQVKWEGITAKQREQLNKRSPSTNSAVENWNAVYKILFPGDPVPASPYIDMSLSGELRAFREHALSTGPSIWDDILRTRLPENLRSSLEELQSFHQSFYSEAITRLFETWNPSFLTPRSLQSQASLSHVRQETEYLAPTSNTAAVDGSSSPSGSDSALGRSVASGSQSETVRSPASQNEVAPPAQTQQQQSTLERDPQALFVPPQLQTTPTVPPSTAQTLFFTHLQTTNVPLGAQYPFNSADFTGYGFPQNAYEPVGVPTFTPSLGQAFNSQYALGTAQSGPAMNRFQYQLPSVDFHEGAFHQPPPADFPHGAFYPSHQMQVQPQYPYNVHTPHLHAPNPNPMGPV